MQPTLETKKEEKIYTKKFQDEFVCSGAPGALAKLALLADVGVKLVLFADVGVRLIFVTDVGVKLVLLADTGVKFFPFNGVTGTTSSSNSVYSIVLA
jgi:hypothetical protein